MKPRIHAICTLLCLMALTGCVPPEQRKARFEHDLRSYVGKPFSDYKGKGYVRDRQPIQNPDGTLTFVFRRVSTQDSSIPYTTYTDLSSGASSTAPQGSTPPGWASSSPASARENTVSLASSSYCTILVRINAAGTILSMDYQYTENGCW